nr:hypothetical protein [Tanacetum cinerariifolium]
MHRWKVPGALQSPNGICFFFIISVQTPGSGISIPLAVGTLSTGSGNLYCQWELSPSSGNALCILFPTVNPPICISCIKQFWNTASIKRSDDIIRLQALVDKKKIVISEVVIREILQLDDAEGYTYFLDYLERCSGSNERIFYIVERFFRCVCLVYPRGMQQSAEDRKNLSEKKKEDEHLCFLSHQYPTDVALRIRDKDTDEQQLDCSVRHLRMSECGCDFIEETEIVMWVLPSGSLSSQILASPSNEKGNSNNLTVVLGTFGCLNVDVTLLKKRRWLCGSCLPPSIGACNICAIVRLSAIVALV